MKRALSMVLVLLFSITLSAAAFAEASPQNETPPPEIEKIIEDYQTIYRLTIQYIYLDGSTAAPTYTEQLNAGTAYSHDSPVIPGYIASRSAVSGVMPARDMEYTVIYIPEASGRKRNGEDGISLLTIEDYETALGFGARFMHVGVCIE